jgi:hypothetical protein
MARKTLRKKIKKGGAGDIKDLTIKTSDGSYQWKVTRIVNGEYKLYCFYDFKSSDLSKTSTRVREIVELLKNNLNVTISGELSHYTSPKKGVFLIKKGDEFLTSELNSVDGGKYDYQYYYRNNASDPTPKSSRNQLFSFNDFNEIITDFPEIIKDTNTEIIKKYGDSNILQQKEN